MTLDSLDPLTKVFFDHAKEITQNLMNHEKGQFFNELMMSHFSRFEWHEVMKQIKDLDTVNRQSLHGQYFNDDIHIISSFNQCCYSIPGKVTEEKSHYFLIDRCAKQERVMFWLAL